MFRGVSGRRERHADARDHRSHVEGRFLNPDGRCRSFDADAKGYVRGEGGGVVLLKPLSAALRDQNPIYALVRGTGINQDGYTPSGITQPSAEAQQALIQKVLHESAVNPALVHYVEAHGTGTPVGDPVEALALNTVLQTRDRVGACFLGSVKSNIGHLEAAAGIAGLIKAALSLKNQKIAPNLHFTKADIPFEKYCLQVPTTVQDFPREEPHFASVNSFGYGGTNAHAVLQSFERKVLNSEVNQPLLFPFTSKHAEGFKAVAKDYAHFLKTHPEVALVDMAHTLSYHRTFFEHRLAVSADSKKDLEQKLQLIANAEMPEGCVQGKKLDSPTLAFVYTGMGPQWWGMGRQLLETSETFVKVVRACDKALQAFSIFEELSKPESQSLMDDPIISQVANYTLQAGLTEILKSFGVTPQAIVGHSIGEVAAAYAAGVLTLEEGVQLSYLRARIQATRKGEGAMLAIGLGGEEAQALVEKNICIAAENSQNSVTLSGDKNALSAVAEILENKNIYNRFLNTNIAYHSYQMDGLEEAFLETLQNLDPKDPKIALYSSVYGDAGTRVRDAHYWWQNIRQPVLFATSLQTMIVEGHRLFVEIGPHPVLANYIREGLQFSGVKGETIATLNRKKEDKNSLQECLGGLYVHGYAMNWKALQPTGNFAHLPTYAWQKKTYWIESEESKHYRLSSNAHVMLSRKVKTAVPAWSVEVNAQYFPWLEDHKIEGTTVFPGAAYAEAGLALCRLGNPEGPCILEDVDFQNILTIPKDKEPILHMTLDRNTFKVHSLDGMEWICHAVGKCTSYTLPKPPKMDLETLCSGHILDTSLIYQKFKAQGLDYGHAFQGIQKLWRHSGEAVAELHGASHTNHIVHPALLDAAFQTLIGTVGVEFEGIILPTHIDRLVVHHIPTGQLFCHARVLKNSKDEIVGDLALCDNLGNVSVQVKGLTCSVLSRPAPKLTYRPEWVERPLEGTQGKSDEDPIFICDSSLSESELVTQCLNLVKALPPEQKTTLWIVTRETQAVGPKVHCEGASLWGLGRAIRQECAHIRCRLIDLGDEHDPEQMIKREAGSAEDEIAWREQKRYVFSLKKDETNHTKKISLSSYSLELKTPGSVESLFYRHIEKPLPKDREVVVQVHTCALNFKDLMKVMGLLNKKALQGTYFGESFGMECSGTVIAIGAKVKKVKIGDQVCAFAPNTFRSYLAVSENHVAPGPHFPLEEAPVYVPFITVLRALKDLGKLKKGERLLIHSATGAVGLAAIQYAKYVGATIFATAGSAEKREYLRQLGIEKCADSRSLSFADEIGEVDVVLNSLGGEALPKSFSLLAPYGRFIEIGKRDISLNSPLPMRDFDRNTTFASIDLDRTFVDRPKIIRRLLKETANLFQKGIFKPLPCKTFPAGEVVEAFQYMARAKHIGKVMLKFKGEQVQGLKPIVCPYASYLITGAFSGFGLAVAEWLAHLGAKHLILIGRKGPTTPEALALLDRLKKNNVQVQAAAADVTDLSQLSELLNNVPSLKGVIHSAMILEDAFIADQNPETIQKVLRPKIDGCLNLHKLTSKHTLDFFVLFSSISSLIGNPGQANYAAANAFLDTFCHFRRSLGLPALTINWGALKVGVLAQNTRVAQHLESHGIKGIPTQVALKALEDALQENIPQRSVLDVDWTQLMKQMPALKNSVFSAFCAETDTVTTSAFVEELQGLEENKRLSLILSKVQEMIGNALKQEPHTLDIHKRLNTLGVDSLMAMELQITMESQFGVRVPTMELMKGPTIEQLAHLALKLLKLN